MKLLTNKTPEDLRADNRAALTSQAEKQAARNYRALARTCLKWARQHKADGKPLSAARELRAALEYRWAANLLLAPIDVRPKPRF